MKTRRIRIHDKKNNIISVELPQILIEIQNGQSYFWSILYIYGSGHLEENKSIKNFEKQVQILENGFYISWEQLNDLSTKFWDLIDITIIASKEEKKLRRFESDEKMYETCDFVIEMIDSNYWEVSSKDAEFILRLSKKFKKVELLE